MITSIADNPINVRQAFWSPDRKFLRLIEEHATKRAAAAESHAWLAGGKRSPEDPDEDKAAARPTGSRWRSSACSRSPARSSGFVTNA